LSAFKIRPVDGPSAPKNTPPPQADSGSVKMATIGASSKDLAGPLKGSRMAARMNKPYVAGTYSPADRAPLIAAA
jgi:hypothetical protein